jgi:nitroimidazol reductase NimA-like FMN-containing flavoprotein (pyridoxamine 5'-phosphate oxidase superfamily)
MGEGQRAKGKEQSVKRTRSLLLALCSWLFALYYSPMTFLQTDRTTLKRLPKRGHFDREIINSILDEGFICHVGFVVDGQPFVIPTGYARVDDQLFIHGSQASRMLKNLSQGIDVCVTVTLVDGLVLARSAFHHSINYRSVVVFGTARLLNDREEKIAALLALSEHFIKGRWDDVREPTEQELKATSVLAMKLEEASAKIRTGPPLDDEEDYSLPIWAGVIPLKMVASEPISDPRLPDNIEAPAYARRYRR